MRDAHSTAISGMSFVQREPLLITNGADNAIRVSCVSLPKLSPKMFMCISSKINVLYFVLGNKHVLYFQLHNTVSRIGSLLKMQKKKKAYLSKSFAVESCELRNR